MEADPLLPQSCNRQAIDGSYLGSSSTKSNVVLPQQMGIFITSENKSMMTEVETELLKNGLKMAMDANRTMIQTLRMKVECLDRSLQKAIYCMTAGGWSLYVVFFACLLAAGFIMDQVIHQTLLVAAGVIFTVVNQLKLNAHIRDYELNINDTRTLIREISAIEVTFYFPSPPQINSTELATQIQCLWGRYDELQLRISTAPPAADAFSANNLVAKVTPKDNLVNP